MDVTLCVHVGAGIENWHILAIPVNNSHTEIAMYSHVHEALHTLFGDLSSTKLISVATNGASNMTGRVQGAVTLFEKSTLSGFFGIWCAAH